MPVNTEVTLPKFLTRRGEVELLEFFAERRACDDCDREIVFPTSAVRTTTEVSHCLSIFHKE
jgi:hypothetical protein